MLAIQLSSRIQPEEKISTVNSGVGTFEQELFAVHCGVMMIGGKAGSSKPIEVSNIGRVDARTNKRGLRHSAGFADEF